MSFKVAATLAGAFASVALAHGTVTGIKVDGTYQAGYDLSSYYKAQQGGEIPTIAAWSAENLDNGFVPPSDYGTSDIACHKKAAPGKTSMSVKAGGTVEFQWSAWPESHIGPVLTYVAKCSGKCTSADPATLKWVKIDAAGLDGTWAAADLIKNNNTWTTTVPETLAAGSYVFRHEIIALHGAGSKDGAQNYPQCFNIDITGSGTDNPEGTLTTELYTDSEPGILFDPYKGSTTYEIPGPALYGSASGTKPVVPDTPSNGTISTPAPSAPTPVAPTPVAPTSLVTSVAAAAATQAVEVPSTEAPVTEEEGSEDGALPKTFTLDTFIDWLRSKNGASKKVRRHARQF
ncbi:murein transglycosylase [Fusarium bulbicola]|nr:murein transglycosylase [Fusarium bulbicola]